MTVTDAHWIINGNRYAAMGPIAACNYHECGYYDGATGGIISASDTSAILKNVNGLFPDSGFKSAFYLIDIPTLIMIIVILIIMSTTFCWCCVDASYHFGIPAIIFITGTSFHSKYEIT